MSVHRGRVGLAELCYEAADGDPLLALWLALWFMGAWRRAERSDRAAA